MRRLLTLFTVLLCCGFIVEAQQCRLFTLEDGLSGTRVNQVFQDSKGMIWTATESGLSRYDGAKTVSFKSDSDDPGAIAHNIVRYIFEDPDGHLFVCTHMGIQIFDRATESFSPLATYPSGETFEGNINNMLLRPDGEVWASGNILCKVSVQEGAPFVERLDLPIPSFMTERVYGDSRGALWLTVFDDGLYRLSSEGDVSHFFFMSGEVNVTDICESSDGVVYASTTDGRLYRYDRRSDAFEEVLSFERIGATIFKMLAREGGDMMLGTDGAGIKYFSPANNFLMDFQVSNSQLESSKLKVHSLILDHTGNLWMGLYQKGIAFQPQRRSGFDYIGHRSVNADIIGSCCVTGLCLDATGRLWVGTDNDGIYAVLGGRRGNIHIPADPRSNLAPNTVVGLFCDSTGRIWFGSYIGGFGYIDVEKKRCVYLDRAKSVYSFAEDSQGRVWIGSMGSGLMYFDRKTEEVVYDSALNEKVAQWISTILVSKDGLLYVGSYDGLAAVDLTSLQVRPHILDGLLVHDIIEDRLGQICAGTTQGLYIIDPDTGEYRVLSTADGIPDNFVYAVEQDGYGHLWISTGAGLTQLDPFSYKATNFFAQDGILAGEFSQGVSCSLSGSILWFGGSSGVVSFNSSDISEPSKDWPVRLTGFYLYNHAITGSTVSGRHSIIGESIYDAREFRLRNRDNSFMLEFAPLEYDAPASLRYCYKSDGEEWTTLPQGVNNVTVTGLDPGHHLYSIKSTVWGIESEEYSIDVYVAPAWWQTWWAICLYVLIAGSFVARLTLQTRKRLAFQNEQELNEAKTQFFMNLSHEIRTPMSLIMGPLQTLIDEDDDPARQKSYRLIQRNGQRILQLVNQMMDIRKIECGQMRLSFCPAMVVRLVDSVCELFVPQAEKKHISFDYIHDVSDDLVLWIDAEGFEKILVNLLSNAFKFTPDGGRVCVSLAEEGGRAVISVSDSGVGIPQDELERVFDRFYQSSTVQGHSMGTGIGLNLTKSLVVLHHGTIEARSNAPDAGTTFVVSLPIGCSHLADEEKSSTLVDFTRTQTPQLSSEEPVPVTSSGAKTRKRLLIVEDDDEIKHYMSDELSSDFYILTASNGKEALDLVFKKSPDVVVSDVIMPEMDGYELCRRIKGNINLNHIPVILLTAKTLDEDKIKGLEGGADAYMTKPFNIEVLRSTVINQLTIREKLKVTYTDSQNKTSAIEELNLKTPDEKLLERVMAVVNANLSNPDLTVEEMAAEVGLSRVHLHRKLKELTNQTPHEFLRNARLLKAASMFEEKKHSISDVAYAVGFTSPANFATAFKTLFGVTPSEYMQDKLQT